MITMRQMEELTGVSRRMLQDYDTLGLLRHRDTTPGGYWLYNEDDIERLITIQLLRSHGYTRKDVLRLLGDPDQPLPDLLRHAECALQERRTAIDRILRRLRLLRLGLLLPPEAAAALPQLALQAQDGPSLLTKLLDSGDDADVQIALFFPAFHAHRHEPCDHPQLQQYLAAMHQLCATRGDATLPGFRAHMSNLLQHPEFDSIFGEGCREFLMQCMEAYCQREDAD